MRPLRDQARLACDVYGRAPLGWIGIEHVGPTTHLTCDPCGAKANVPRVDPENRTRAESERYSAAVLSFTKAHTECCYLVEMNEVDAD